MQRFTFLLLFCTLLFACQKKRGQEDQGSRPKSNSEQKTLKGRQLPPNLNSDALRMIDDIRSPDYAVAIIDNPNYGKFSSKPEYDIIMSGKTEPGVSITIDGNRFMARQNGQWLRQSGSFKNFYGKSVNVNITDGVKSKSAAIYIPKPVLANRLSQVNRPDIRRSGNTLTWKPDPKNPSNKVALHYRLYNHTSLSDDDGMIQEDIILMDDNGSYNLDQILSNTQVKMISFKLVSGNTISMTSSKNEKILFHISTYDHHKYIIT